MKISLNWVQQYLNSIDQVDAAEVAQKLTNTIAEVEEYYQTGEGLDKIVVGEILEIDPHPKNEKLLVCKIEIGSNKTIQVVSGASNAQKGDKVPVCLSGGSILDPLGKIGEQKSYKIIEKDLQGVKSQGMMCSIKELGLFDEHKGVMILSKSEPVGSDLTSILQDTILEIENKSLTHRPDCFSHLGIAREIAANFNLEINNEGTPSAFTKTNELALTVDRKVDEKICKRFSIITIAGISVEQSPFWLMARLAHLGQKPVNNIVDISNYTMLDKGQPNHIFDYDKLAGKKIIIRESREGEEIITIDGVKHKLPKGLVVLADNEKLIGIPGIMGGLETEVTKETTNIAIMVENWDMYTIRRLSRELKIRTEASLRFEKGLDPNMVIDTIKNVSTNIIDLTGGEIASDIIDIYPEPEEERSLTFDMNLVKKILGLELTKDEIVDILESLQIEVLGDEMIEENKLNFVDESNRITLKIPSFRRDINIKEDILEEIARMYGYQKFLPSLPSRSIEPSKDNLTRKNIKYIQNEFVNLGGIEILSYSMIGEKLAKRAGLDIGNCLKITNPLSPELSYMRNSLIPSVLEKFELNIKNKFDNFSLFEISRIIDKNNRAEKNIPAQPYHLCVGFFSKTNDSFSNLKSFYEKIVSWGFELELENLNGRTTKDFPESFHPVQSGLIKLNGKSIGIIGNIHPQIRHEFNINGNLSIMEIDLTKIIESNLSNHTKYQPISTFPALYRDLSFWLPKKTEVEKILKSIENNTDEIIRQISVIDIYEDKKKQDKKSIAFNVELRSLTHTLEEEEANKIITEIIEKITKSFQGELRSQS